MGGQRERGRAGFDLGTAGIVRDFGFRATLMQRVVGVVLLRSIQPGTPGDRREPWRRSASRNAVEYMFGNTAGMARFTPTDFIGQFSVPNDFRAILGEPR